MLLAIHTSITVYILAALLEPIPKAIPYKEFSIQYTSVFNQ
jgi:hypothetical protein